VAEENVVIYIRKSREDEGKGEAETLFNQRQSLITLAENKNYKYTIFEEVESSVDFDRPELVKMLNELQTGRYSKILCTKLDRIAREGGIFSEVKKICIAHNILIETPSTMYDLKEKNQKMMYNFSSLIAEAEYDEIRERLARGKVNTVQYRNRWIGSSAPFGYFYDKNTKTLIPHPEESKVFRKMVELALEGNSFSQIAATLNDAGHRTQNNNRWTAGRIQKILKNNTYLGYAKYNSSTVNEKAFATGCHDALMTEDEQQRIFSLSSSRRNYESTRSWGKTKTVLDGLVFCYKCKRGMTIQISKKKTQSRGEWSFYQARRCIYFDKDGIRCDNHGCKIDILEAALIEDITLYKKEIEEALKSIDSQDNSKIVDDMNNKIDDLKNLLKKHDSKISKLTDLFLDEVLSREEYDKRRNDLEKQKENMSNELVYLEEKLSNMNTESIKKVYDETLNNIEIFLDKSLDVATRNRVLKLVVNRIELTKETQYSQPIVDIDYIQLA
jgi:site-specific DNA recombinase